MPPANPSALRVDPADTALLVVDVQTKLAAVMPAEELAQVTRNLGVLIALARRLGWPVVLSEQYPQGLGPTLPVIAEALGPETIRTEKMTFSCTDHAPFAETARTLGKSGWVVAGMEAHVCVYQTVRGLCEAGARVFVPADAVVSRAPTNRARGLELADRAGAIVSSTEIIAFDALGRAGTDDFRAISRLLR